MIVIHPGTRFLRIGRASDVFPLEVPHVIARKSKIPVSSSFYVSSIVGKSNGKEKRREAGLSRESNAMDVDQTPRELWDPVSPSRNSPVLTPSPVYDLILYSG